MCGRLRVGASAAVGGGLAGRGSRHRCFRGVGSSAAVVLTDPHGVVTAYTALGGRVRNGVRSGDVTGCASYPGGAGGLAGRFTAGR